MTRLRAQGHPGAADAPGLAVETATWRPVEVVEVDGWQVGLSGGFTRRGNSVAALEAPADPAAALDRVERLFSDHGLPSIVRVCGRSAPEGLDALLEDRGYAVVAPTAVMAVDLVDLVGPGTAWAASGDGPARAAPGVRITSGSEPDLAWLRGWLAVKASSTPDLDLAARLLGGARARYLAAVEEEPAGTARVLGVIRVAPAHGWAALSCLTVLPEARRRGLGTLLTRSALTWARQAGAERAFVQVEATNSVAVALDEALGFRVVDRYHYRQR